MKFLTLILMFLFVGDVYANAYGSNSFNADASVKSRRSVFTYVENGQGAAFDAGDIVCHDIGEDDGVHADYCDNIGDPAYCMVMEACNDGAMCKCLLEGYTSVLDFDGSGEAGTAGTAVVADIDGNSAGVSGSSSTEAAYKIIGTFLDTVSTSTTVEAYIKF
jgi:hypothetical protein